MEPQVSPSSPHRPYEDALALLLGTLFVALGVAFYTQATLLTGSTAGMAFLLQYATGWSFGVWFFLINLPFYWLAIKRMGWSFTLRTFAAIGLVSLFSELTGRWISIDSLAPFYGALMGGCLIGIGMLILFRHRASLGGVNILVLYLQDRYGLRAGYVQLAIDGVIMLVGLALLPADRVGLSVLGAVALNLIIALNHKPGRYMGVS
ncbi:MULTISPECIES: YitT family protein [Halomonas]|uniref:YitT family protein n=2 Tax=Halomonas TaxID=2745 RepID=A0A7X5ANG4_9GAMM|nr:MULTISPECIES: YitT family protein [Halomonas]MDR5900642.1 YitT family protein [Halomonas icarae]NAW13889.1 YitT family protein [Halomonas icarae]TDB01252.1 YitT family protein [Halomonas marinisediminis]